MKTKLTKILGVVFTLTMVASLLAFAAPVSAETLAFSAETIPGTTGKVITVGQSASDIAVSADGKTVYAAMGAAKILYKSTNGGETWTELSSAMGTTSFPNKNVDLVSVAPDNADIITIVCNDFTVYYSSNGGSSWGNLASPTGTSAWRRIDDIDISSPYSGYNYAAVVGENTTATGLSADLWVMKLSVGEPWNRRANVVTANFTRGQARAKAVKCSPSFGTDRIVTFVTAGPIGVTSTTPNVYFQIYSDDSKKFNGAVTGYEQYTDAVAGTFGIKLNQISIPTTGIYLAKASIALAPDYDGTDDVTRIAFVGAATGNVTTAAVNGGGVARLIDNNHDKEIKTWTNATLGGINSVSYDGSMLIAGAYNSNTVFRCLDPLATTPKCERLNDYKKPGGTGNTTASFAGDAVVASTGGNNSAFAISDDDGNSFNDISLVNTALTALRDVQIATDGSKVYLVSDNGQGGTFTSLWRKASMWQRVFSVQATSFIIRVAPDDNNAIYLARIGADDVYFSSDAGQTVWKKRPSTKIAAIVDLAVQNVTTAFVVGEQKISKTTNSAASWGTAKTIGLNPHMVSLAPNNDILIGENSTAGGANKIAYSTDGGSTFTIMDNAVGANATQNIIVIADPDYANNSILYAANKGEAKLYRGKLAKDTTWTSKDSGFTANYLVTALAMYAKTLYVGTATATNSEVLRTFNPTAEAPTWSAAIRAAGFTYNRPPSSLRISMKDNIVKLWAINSRGVNSLMSLDDVVALNGPKINGPADKYSLSVNPEDGWAYSVTFSFDRPSDKATKAQLQIATDTAFNSLVYSDAAIATTGSTATTGQVIRQLLMPDSTYYWRVRVSKDGPWYSPWSEVRTIVVGKIPAREFKDLTPPITVTTTPAPQITVTTPPATVITIPPAPTPQPAVPTYMLWIIIGVGAVLFIAVIVLIVRTRRVV